MRLRVAALAGVALVTAVGGASLAAPARIKPVCNLASDAPGDASWQFGQPESLDVLSADLASDGKDITVVARLKNYADPDQASPIGRKWLFSFKAPGSNDPMYILAINDPVLLAPNFEFGKITGANAATGAPTYSRGGSARGTVDAARKEVRVHVPASDFNKFGPSLKSGIAVSNFTVRTFAMSNNYSSVYDTQVDTAQSTISYTLGKASCVKVGL